MRPQIGNRNFGTDEGRLIQTRYWMEIGGYGISPDMLVLTGFWNQAVLKKFGDEDHSRTIEQIYGGVIRFQPLEGKVFEAKLSNVMNALNRILQVKRHVTDIIDWIPRLLKQEWHSSELDLLPADLGEELMERIKTDKSYIISSDPQVVRQLLSAMDVLKEIRDRAGYYSGIYREANTLFGRMVLETVSMSMNNLSTHSTSQPRYIDLEHLADVETDNIIEGKVEE